MKILKKPHGSAILTTIFLMFGILSISLIGLDVILGGMAARRAQGASARAFFAAESGIERALSTFKIKGEDILGLGVKCGGKYLYFDGIDAETMCISDSIAKNNWLSTPNISPSYWAQIKSINGRVVELVAQGSYQKINRELYIKFCLPSCKNKATNAPDECGGTCK